MLPQQILDAQVAAAPEAQKQLAGMLSRPTPAAPVGATPGAPPPMGPPTAGTNAGELGQSWNKMFGG